MADLFFQLWIVIVIAIPLLSIIVIKWNQIWGICFLFVLLTWIFFSLWIWSLTLEFFTYVIISEIVSVWTIDYVIIPVISPDYSCRDIQAESIFDLNRVKLSKEKHRRHTHIQSLGIPRGSCPSTGKKNHKKSLMEPCGFAYLVFRASLGHQSKSSPVTHTRPTNNILDKSHEWIIFINWGFILHQLLLLGVFIISADIQMNRRRSKQSWSNEESIVRWL